MSDEYHPNHEPVLCQEVMELLHPVRNTRILDVTLGLAGHALHLINMTNGEVDFVGFDADINNIQLAKRCLGSRMDHCTIYHDNFLHIAEYSIGTFDYIFADLGISSPHLDIPERGFSFKANGPLDMRLNRTEGLTASALIEQSSQEEIAEILWKYGEIQQTRRLSEVLKKNLPKTTHELVQLAESVFSYKTASMLPKIFQALRIAVNHELESLETLLEYAPTILNPNGKLAIISFHSLEDRFVKRAFKRLSTPIKDEYTGGIAQDAKFRILTKKPIVPSEEEVERNPRSRSAKLRVLQKVS